MLPWQAALMAGGASMLGGDQRLSTGQLLARGLQGGLAGAQAAQQAGADERQDMLKMALLQGRMQDSAAQRQAFSEDRKRDQASALVKQGHLEVLTADKSPEEQALIFLGGDDYVKSRIAANAPMTSHQQAQIDLGNKKFGASQAMDRERLDLTRQGMTADHEVALMKAAADREKFLRDDPASKELAKLNAKHTFDRQLNIGGEIADAQSALSNVDEMLALNEQASSGPIAGALNFLDKGVESATFGYGGIGVDSAAGAELKSRISNEVLNAASKLSGTISDKDMEVLEEAAGGGNLSREGRARVFNIMRDGYQKKLGALQAEKGALDSGKDVLGAKSAASSSADAPAVTGDYSKSSDDELKAAFKEMFGG